MLLNLQLLFFFFHIHDLSLLLLKLIDKTETLPACETFIASPSGATSNKKLFREATRDFYRKPLKPMFNPKPLTYPGIIVKNILGKMRLAPKPFEKLWMLNYLDKDLNVDASYTNKTLSWQPTPRYHILRRLVFLLDKMKSHPNEWHILNEAATKRHTAWPNFIIYEHLVAEQENIESQIIGIINSEDNKARFGNYQKMTLKDLKTDISTKYHLILASARSADRSLMLKYLDDIALQKYTIGFESEEIKSAFDIFDKIITCVNCKSEIQCKLLRIILTFYLYLKHIKIKYFVFFNKSG